MPSKTRENPGFPTGLGNTHKTRVFLNPAQNSSQVEVKTEIQSQGVSSKTLQEILDQANVLTVPADVKTQIVGESVVREREIHQPPAKKPKSDVTEWLDEIFFPNRSTTPDSGEDQEVKLTGRLICICLQTAAQIGH